MTVADVIETVPFGNEMRVVEMYGSDLLETLCGLAQVMPGNGSFPQFSKEVGVVLDTLNRHLLKFTVRGQEVNLDKVYRIVTYDYITDGRGRFKIVKERKLLDVPAGFEVAEGVMDYIHDREVVVPKLDGRLRIGLQNAKVDFEAKHLILQNREEYPGGLEVRRMLGEK